MLALLSRIPGGPGTLALETVPEPAAGEILGAPMGTLPG
jgi:hypothetical protein